eukprot:8913463-Pyramimonas_sp.AAC.1
MRGGTARRSHTRSPVAGVCVGVNSSMWVGTWRQVLFEECGRGDAPWRVAVDAGGIWRRARSGAHVHVAHWGMRAGTTRAKARAHARSRDVGYMRGSGKATGGCGVRGAPGSNVVRRRAGV